MIRRTFLKALMASPVGFLLKPKSAFGTDLCNEALRKLGLDEIPLTGPTTTSCSVKQFYSGPLGVPFTKDTITWDHCTVTRESFNKMRASGDSADLINVANIDTITRAQ